MRKKVLVAACISAMTVLGILSIEKNSKVSQMLDDNCEALTACDVVQSWEEGFGKKKVTKTKVLFLCVGEEGQCSIDKDVPLYGHVQLNCSGREVDPEEED